MSSWSSVFAKPVVFELDVFGFIVHPPGEFKISILVEILGLQFVTCAEASSLLYIFSGKGRFLILSLYKYPSDRIIGVAENIKLLSDGVSDRKRISCFKNPLPETELEFVWPLY
jgi:hypothetical protein